MAGIRTWMERPSSSPTGRLAASLLIGLLSATAAWQISGGGSGRTAPRKPSHLSLASPRATVMLAAPAPPPPWRGCAFASTGRGQAGGDASRAPGVRHAGRLVDPSPLSTPSTAQRPGTLGQTGGDALGR